MRKKPTRQHNPDDIASSLAILDSQIATRERQRADAEEALRATQAAYAAAQASRDEHRLRALRISAIGIIRFAMGITRSGVGITRAAERSWVAVSDRDDDVLFGLISW